MEIFQTTIYVVILPFVLCLNNNDNHHLLNDLDWSSYDTTTASSQDDGGYESAPVWDVSKPIPFAFKAMFTKQEKERVREGIKRWSAKTCVQYVEVPYDSKRQNSIYIQRPDPSFNPTGSDTLPQDVQTRTQAVELSKKVLSSDSSISRVTHEFGHSLGLSHEQQRADRKLEILYDNIDPAYAYAFDVSPDLITEDMPYDVTSIMHYDGIAFSKDSARLLTMRTLDPDNQNVLGLGQMPSFNDFKKVNLHYNCVDMMCRNQPLSQPCLNQGYQDPTNCSRCICPTGTSGRFCNEIEPPVGFIASSCGGIIELKPCSATKLLLPTYPNQYPFGASCTWIIKSESCSLQFAFEQSPKLQCYSNLASGDCVDFVEIRSDFERLDVPGKFFCSCSKTRGRKIVVNSSVAMVRFESVPTKYRPWEEFNNGFQLTAFATCGRQIRECKITSSGYDASGKPFCRGAGRLRDITLLQQKELPLIDGKCSSPNEGRDVSKANTTTVEINAAKNKKVESEH